MRKCQVCEKEMEPACKCTTMICKKRLCSPDCAAIWGDHYAMKQRARAKKDEEKLKKEIRKQNRADVRRLNEGNLPHQRKLTQRECNRMVRLLDIGANCPTCNQPLVDGSYDAGHVRTVASCPELRFDPRNIFGQCRGCNGSGTLRKRTRKTQEVVYGIYKAWIYDTKGELYYEWLFGPHPLPHYTCDQLKTMRSEFAAECRRLAAGHGPSRDWRALNRVASGTNAV